MRRKLISTKIKFYKCHKKKKKNKVKGHEKLKTDEEAMAGNLCCKINKKTIKDSLKSKKLQKFMTSLIHGREEKKEQETKFELEEPE